MSFMSLVLNRIWLRVSAEYSFQRGEGRERQREGEGCRPTFDPSETVASCFPIETPSILKFIYLTFQLVMETRATGDYRGDIAIDDFTITGTVCPGERECIMIEVAHRRTCSP